MKVAFQWPIEESLRLHFKNSLPEVEFLFPDSKETEHILELQKEAEVIVGWRISSEKLKGATSLGLFINPGAGIQHLSKNYKEDPPAQKFKIVNSHSNAFNTAQHTVTLCLTLLNRILPHHNYLADGQWRTDDKDAASDIIRGKTIGLMGYGHIAKIVQQMLTPFECKFIAYKRKVESETSIKLYDETQLFDFLDKTDVLIHLLPETDKTLNLIGEEELGCLGRSAYVISVGRGPVINESAFFKALKSKEIAGAAIDVWYEYNPEEDKDGKKYPWHYPFNELDNVLLSPHRAGKPLHDLRRWEDVIENIKRAAEGRTDFLNLIDLSEGY